jgi:hypothetical protein
MSGNYNSKIEVNKALPGRFDEYKYENGTWKC